MRDLPIELFNLLLDTAKKERASVGNMMDVAAIIFLYCEKSHGACECSGCMDQFEEHFSNVVENAREKYKTQLRG